jgi:anti-sigma B factor antagonist
MMATQNKVTAEPTDQERQQDSICFAELGDGVVVIRVFGRGSFANSVELKSLADAMLARPHVPKTRFVIDLKRCSTMDSTFMGILASIGLRQKRDSEELTAVVNANPQTDRLLQTLGLSHFLDIRPMTEAAAAEDAQFHTAECDKVDRVGQIIHMIQAHECLCDANSKNEVQFEGVLKYLNESLKREQT